MHNVASTPAGRRPLDEPAGEGRPPFPGSGDALLAECTSGAERVAAHIRRLIVSGQLVQGARVKENKIAEDLGISRAPVREAVSRLVQSRLLEAVPNAGSRVARLDERLIDNAYDLREQLEGLAARLAAANMTGEERRDLLDLVALQEAHVAEHGAVGYASSDADWAFHLRLLRGSRNEYVLQICGADMRDVMTLLHAQLPRTDARGRRALLEHRWIAEAIRDGYGDLAALHMARHIRSSRRAVLETLWAVDRAPDPDP
jgi:DNA-binding GntR family transcriptional regulator